jgi:hypothetical protein
MRGYARFVLIGLLILGLFCAPASADANNSSASVTGLTVDDSSDTWIKWTWIKPSDSDFNHTMVFIDGAFQMNVSNSTNFYNATGFTEGTSHKIGTHTVDTYGNVNATWVNDTASTLNIPPASVTGLGVSAVGDTWINWTWTKPSDSDFNHTMVFIDGAFQMNVSNSTNFYNATGFTEGTSHKIGTHTVDILGNINSAWENHTASTSDNTPPASITNVQNTTGDHWIEWTWTKPSDSDLDHTMIYIDGVWKENVTSSAVTYNYINISSSTPFTISTKTVDTNGNINNTWINNTATTLADTTPPGNVIGLTATTGIDWIKWTWTNPLDFDFNHTMISIDGGTAVNQSTTFYNATGLTSSASYTINIKTVDTTGRINSPGISNSSTTLSKTFYTGNLIWDALSSPSPVYTWTARSYSGFYYDLDSDMGSETLTITQAGGSVASGGLVYTTVASWQRNTLLDTLQGHLVYQVL